MTTLKNKHGAEMALLARMAHEKGCKRQLDGRVILASHQGLRVGEQHLRMVLCIWRGEFVVWYQNHETEGFGQGDYFDPEVEGGVAAAHRKAMIRFFERAGRLEGLQVESIIRSLVEGLRPGAAKRLVAELAEEVK